MIGLGYFIAWIFCTIRSINGLGYFISGFRCTVRISDWFRILYCMDLLYNDMVTYSCKMGYVHAGGDLERTCGRNRRWSGVPPSCTSMHFNFTFNKIHVVIRNVVRYQRSDQNPYLEEE